MSEQGIISGFQELRQIEQAIVALGRTTTEGELIAGARALVKQFPTERLITTILRHLGDTNSQLRGGLGHLCALLPPDSIAPVLRDLAGNRQRIPVERMTALLILERYLGEVVPAPLTSDLAGNDDIAMESLLEAVEEGRRNRHVLLEYVTQMQEHGVDVAFMVLGLINRLAPEDRGELLRLIAQDGRSQVARAALDRLILLAASVADALRALHTLQFTLPPPLAEQTQRALRKLQFTGRRFVAPAPERWRALLGPTDAGGYFTLWLVRMPALPASADGVLIGFTLALHQGIVECSGVESMEMSQLPPLRNSGEVALVGDGPERRVAMVEMPFDAGRWLVKHALATHWQLTERADLPGEYRLYNDLFWQFAAPVLPDEYHPCFDNRVSTGLEEPDMTALGEAASALVPHPIMRAWVGWAANIWATLGTRHDDVAPEHSHALINYVLREIDALPQRDQLLDNMAAALRTQALWLAVHGDAGQAAHALTLARWMRALPMRQNPLLAALLHVGLFQARSRKD